MKYPISEIFYSIQGEGMFSGKAAVFIRFAGCNFDCSWCDTDYSKKRSLNVDDIIESINDEVMGLEQGFNIVLTGGEPTLNNLMPLVEELVNIWPNAQLELETNGTNKLQMKTLLDEDVFITCSPKLHDGAPATFWNGPASALKLVYEGQELSNFDCYGKRLFLQPLFIEGDELATRHNLELTVVQVKENPEWILSVQTQKVLNIR